MASARIQAVGHPLLFEGWAEGGFSVGISGKGFRLLVGLGVMQVFRVMAFWIGMGWGSFRVFLHRKVRKLEHTP